MKTLEFQAVEFGRSDPRLVEAAELLLNEVVHKDNHEPIKRGELRDFIGTVDQRDHILYGMFDERDVALAAAEVGHNDAGCTTSVWHIAVAEERRDEGLGTTFMKHLACVALEAGDQTIWVPVPRSDFFEKLRFTQYGENSMSILAATLAQA